MHSSHELRSEHFAIEVEGRPAALGNVFPGFDDDDRLGIVLREPCGAVGASGLLLAAVTGFYDVWRSRGGDFFVYPDYFLFHVGRPLGDHSYLDVWPGHKEVVVAPEPEEILRAVNDRGVTRLLVEDRAPNGGAFDRETLASARHRIATCLAYSPSGRTAGADVSVASNEAAERYVRAVLDPRGTVAELRAGDGAGAYYADAVEARAGEVDDATRARLRAGRDELVEDGRPVETYRRVDLDEALRRL